MSSPSKSHALPSKLVSKQEVAEGTMAFRFEKPAGWKYQAGQTLDLTLVDPPETDAEGNIRTFTIASPPSEDTLMIATRMRDTAFKRVLKKMPEGSAVKLEGPSGDLTLDPDAARTIVFLAGGIGITPFHSMSLDAAQRKLPHHIFLFYSNRRPEDAAFLDQMQALETQNPNYKCIPTMTDMEKSQRLWHGETGMIRQGLLTRYLKNAASPIYYIAGPPDMVKGLHTMVKDAGVADDSIRAEEFDGY
jgi:ferredoxin-NADP reductase